MQPNQLQSCNQPNAESPRRGLLLQHCAMMWWHSTAAQHLGWLPRKVPGHITVRKGQLAGTADCHLQRHLHNLPWPHHRQRHPRPAAPHVLPHGG